jgi:hypothetical protein
MQPDSDEYLSPNAITQWLNRREKHEKENLARQLSEMNLNEKQTHILERHYQKYGNNPELTEKKKIKNVSSKISFSSHR